MTLAIMAYVINTTQKCGESSIYHMLGGEPTMNGISMARTIICPVCKKQWDFRVGFAHESLNKHLKEHK